MRKVIITLTFILLILILVLYKIIPSYAQSGRNACIYVGATPHEIEISSPQDIQIVVALSEESRIDLPVEELRLAFGITSSLAGWQTVPFTENPDAQGNRLLRATIPQTMLNLNGIARYEYVPQTIHGDDILTINGERCNGSIFISIDQNTWLNHNCGAAGWPENHYECEWTGSGWNLDWQSCSSSGYYVDQRCSITNSNINEFYPYFPVVCAPCLSESQALKGHGRICNDNTECRPELVCRESRFGFGGLECLYPENSQDIGDPCRLNERECRAFSQAPGAPGNALTCVIDSWPYGHCDQVPESDCITDACCQVELNDENARYIRGQGCVHGQIEPSPPTEPGRSDIPAPVQTNPITSTIEALGVTQLCSNITDDQRKENCENCMVKKQPPGLWTPFGCIDIDPQLMVQRILQISIGIAGGIAFLMMAYGTILMMTSTGVPEKINQGKEVFTAAIAGLLLIVFSAIILKIIGVDILQIPGLTGN